MARGTCGKLIIPRPTHSGPVSQPKGPVSMDMSLFGRVTLTYATLGRPFESSGWLVSVFCVEYTCEASAFEILEQRPYLKLCPTVMAATLHPLEADFFFWPGMSKELLFVSLNELWFLSMNSMTSGRTLISTLIFC